MAVRPNRSLRRRIAAALHTQRGLMFVQSVGIIVGLAISTVSLTVSLMIAASTLHGQRERTSADLMLKFDDDLGAGKNSPLLDAIENGDKVLKEDGGKFSDVDLDQLLGVYELIADTNRDGLISDRMVYDAFSYDLSQVYANAEVQKYVTKCAKEDPTIYDGYRALGRRFADRKAAP
jgi:hypothetical protein